MLSSRHAVQCLAGLAGIATSMSLAGPVRAASIHFEIVAEVPTYCQVKRSDSAVVMQNGRADLGTVLEVCNMPQGYDVVTRFTNVRGGQLTVGSQSYTVDEQGVARRAVPVASVQNTRWTLASAQLVDADLPVTMQVNLQPH